MHLSEIWARWKTIESSPCFFGAAVIEEKHRVFNGHYTIFDPLCSRQAVPGQPSLILGRGERQTYVDQKKSSGGLIDDSGLDKREFLLRLLFELFHVFVAVLLGYGAAETMV